MKLELLIGSAEFWKRLKPEITKAKKQVYIQTLSFEGDSVGLDLAETITASPAPDKRIIIDSYTKHIISDRFLYSPSNFFDKSLRNEVKRTHEMIASLNTNGVETIFVNPFGFLYCHIPRRNHKKIIIVDDTICYIGGINFSEHNFSWHDLMLRIESDEVTSFLKKDFLISWEQKHFGGELALDGFTLVSFDGKRNTVLFQPIVDILRKAERSIFVQSPYLCHPFTDYLAQASRRGVDVTIISPQENNKTALKQFIQWQSRKNGYALYMYPDIMMHLKAMLIDNSHLLLGSCNFDYFSYHFEQETVAIITNRGIIDDFKTRVIEKDVAASAPDTNQISSLKGCWRDSQIKIVSKLMHLFN